MSRFSRIVLWLLFWIGACTDHVFGQERLVISDSVLELLGTLADTATIEHAACLLWQRTGVLETDSAGHVWPQVQINYVVYPPQGPANLPGLSPRTSVGTTDCPVGTVIRWHNHILAVSDSLYHKYGWHPPDSLVNVAGRACVLSRMDWITARRSYEMFSMIQVTSKTFCWWAKPELPGAVGPDYALPFLWWPIHLSSDAMHDYRKP